MKNFAGYNRGEDVTKQIRFRLIWKAALSRFSDNLFYYSGSHILWSDSRVCRYVSTAERNILTAIRDTSGQTNLRGNSCLRRGAISRLPERNSRHSRWSERSFLQSTRSSFFLSFLPSNPNHYFFPRKKNKLWKLQRTVSFFPVISHAFRRHRANRSKWKTKGKRVTRWMFHYHVQSTRASKSPTVLPTFSTFTTFKSLWYLYLPFF